MKVTAFIFSSATGQWRRVTFDGWKMNGYITSVLTSCCYHPHISVYKTSKLFSEVLMLDTHKMEFSVVRTPRVLRFGQHAIIEAGEGRLGFFTIGDGMLDLYCKAWQDNGVSAEEWQHEKTIPIPLPDSDRYSISFCGTTMATYSFKLFHETQLSSSRSQRYTISRYMSRRYWWRGCAC
jgi:hypothetical protein